jgi:hypothetical protein
MARAGDGNKGGSTRDPRFDVSFDEEFDPSPKTKKTGRSKGSTDSGGASGSRSFPGPGEGPSFDDALDSLFNKSFGDIRSSTTVSSGDEDIDKAIDLAVDTLFVEDMDIPAPETAELEAQTLESTQTVLPPPPQPTAPPPPPRGDTAHRAQAKQQAAVSKTGRLEKFKRDDEMERFKDTLFVDEPPETEIVRQTASRQAGPKPTPQAPPIHAKQAAQAPPQPVPRPRPPAPAPQPTPEGRPAPAARSAAKPPQTAEAHDVKAVRKLQEAILTLEWEISKRSITILANELQRLKTKFKDDVIVDFAALTMRVVLDYLIRRLRRAHPESIRFLMEVTGILLDGMDSGERDALGTFHEILTLYERYKSVVRKAEGLKDDESSQALKDLSVPDPHAFAELVAAQAHTIAEAGESLALRIAVSSDPENLIRSFRFLVTRSFNRILEGTQRRKPTKKPARPKASVKH